MKKITTLILLNFFFIAIASGQDLKSINPISASQVESIVISIASQNTTFTSGNYSAKLVDPIFSSDLIKATSAIVVNDTLLNASFTFNSGLKKGVYDVVVYDLQTGFSMKLKNAFTLNLPISTPLPVILSVNPTVATQGDTVEMVLKAKNTHFLQPTLTNISIEGANSWVSIISQTVLDNETIKAKATVDYFDKEGIYDIGISNSVDGYIKLNQSFTIKAGPTPPKLISIFPNSGNRLGSVWITIKGKNTFFRRDSCGIALLNSNFYLQPATEIKYLNDTVMIVKLEFMGSAYSYPAGMYDINVFGMMGQSLLTLPNSFMINDTLLPPKVVSFDPKRATQGDSVKLTVKGKNTHFSYGYNNIALRNNITGLGSTTKTLNDTIEEGSFFIDYRYPPGKYAIEISDLVDGLFYSLDSFTIYKGNNPPKLISVTPNNAVQGKKVDLVIKASKNTFLDQFPNPQLSRNNATVFIAKSFSIVNDSTMLASFEFPTDTTRLGAYDFNTTNPISTNNFFLPSSFTINKNPAPPTLISISPSTATQFDTVVINIKASRTHFLTGPVDVMMISSTNPNDYIFSSANNITVLNDSLIQAKYILFSNYYSSAVYDLRVRNAFDGTIEIKSAFTLSRIYLQQPAILDINPKEGVHGQTVTVTIKGNSKSFRTGNNVVRLVDYYVPTKIINATAVNYVNDSLMTATFSFSSKDAPGNYYLHLSNQANLYYYQNGGFILKASPSNSKLLALTPAWASQTDTVSCVLTGANTHFNSTGIIWLENKFGYQIQPFSINVTTDTSIIIKFAFDNTDLPIVYSVNWKDAANNKLVLENAFTLTGSIDAYHLLDVNPKEIMCYVSMGENVTIRATNTHFLSEADTIFIVNNRPLGSNNKGAIYPLTMNILNDTTISAKFMVNNNCGDFDIYVMGKKNYILTGKLHAFPPVSVNEELKEKPLIVFPNPSEGLFTIKVNTDFEQANLSVFDMYGKIILTLDKIEAYTKIDLSDNAAGIYFVKLIKGDKSKAEKIIRQ